MNLITPFSEADKKVKIASLVIIPILLWTMLPNNVFPPFYEILQAIPKLIQKNNLIDNFITSVFFCFKCMVISVLISFGLFVVSRIPIMESFAEFSRKFRFLPSVGLSFLFMRMTSDVSSQMQWIMVFGITTYLLDGVIGSAMSVTKDEVLYAKSLRLGPWESLRELVVYGKAAEFFSAIIQNFAIAWMLLASVENICKSSGGIGVVLSESSKYFHLEEVYAIQILILLTGIILDFVLNYLKGFFFPYTLLKSSK